jgi:hypothetical protein
MRPAPIAPLAVVALACLLLTGCASTPMPDGGRIDHVAGPTGSLTPEPANRQAETNAQMLRERSASRAREERSTTLRDGPPQDAAWPQFDGSWAWTDRLGVATALDSIVVSDVGGGASHCYTRERTRRAEEVLDHQSTVVHEQERGQQLDWLGSKRRSSPCPRSQCAPIANHHDVTPCVEPSSPIVPTNAPGE